MKNKFIKSTLILIIGGFITKILGMIIKIIITRNINENAMGLYMMTLPTYNLFITLVTQGMQVAISKLTSENKLSKRKIINTSLFITMIITFILIFLIIFLSKPISLLLHNENLFLPILSTILSIPFIGISNILKGYFFGKNKMHIQVISNLLEQLVRIIMFLTILPKIDNYILAATFIIGSNLVNELLSVITLSLFMDNKKINLNEFKIDKETKKELLSISIPTTTSRIIGTLSYFLEPIILTNLLIINGYSSQYITYEYATFIASVFFFYGN